MNIIEKTMIMDYNAKVFIIMAIVLSIPFFILLFSEKKFPNRLFIPIMTILSILLLIGCPISGKLFETESDRYKYLAELDDSITINEIYENYENISRNDDGRYYFEDRK